MTIVTTTGVMYLVSYSLNSAYPAKDPNGKCRGNYNPVTDWDADCARACGMFVDATLAPDSYDVRNAGPEWREVYETLRRMKAEQTN